MKNMGYGSVFVPIFNELFACRDKINVTSEATVNIFQKTTPLIKPVMLMLMLMLINQLTNEGDCWLVSRLMCCKSGKHL